MMRLRKLNLESSCYKPVLTNQFLFPAFEKYEKQRSQHLFRLFQGRFENKTITILFSFVLDLQRQELSGNRQDKIVT